MQSEPCGCSAFGCFGARYPAACGGVLHLNFGIIVGRISNHQVASLDLLDKVFFNQCVFQFMSESDVAWLIMLDKHISEELNKEELTCQQIQVARHGVLCMMEIEISNSRIDTPDFTLDTDKISVKELLDREEKIKDYFFANIGAMQECFHKIRKNLIMDVFISVIKRADYYNAPAIIRQCLVERMLLHEFINAPMELFIWLINNNILSSKKFSRAKRIDINSHLFVRLILLCEFDLLKKFALLNDEMANIKHRIIDARNDISCLNKRILRRQLHIDVDHLVDGGGVIFFTKFNLDDPKAIKSMFNTIGEHLTRNRFFQGPMASWGGIICGGYTDIQYEKNDRKLPVFSETSKKVPIANRISDDMKIRGYTIGPRPIYMRHREFKKTLKKRARFYYEYM